MDHTANRIWKVMDKTKLLEPRTPLLLISKGRFDVQLVSLFINRQLGTERWDCQYQFKSPCFFHLQYLCNLKYKEQEIFCGLTQKHPQPKIANRKKEILEKINNAFGVEIDVP